MPHGLAKKVAAHAGVHPNEVSRWGTFVRGHWQIPTLFEIGKAAEVLGVSPCWLAFELGAREPAVAQQGWRWSQEAERDAELARLVAAYLLAPEHEKEIPRAWARSKNPQDALAELLLRREQERRRQEVRAAKRAGQPRSARAEAPRHVREEIESAVARLRVLESGPELSGRSKELVRSVAAQLLGLAPLPAPADRMDHDAPAPAAGDTSLSNALSGGRRSSGPPTPGPVPRGKKKREPAS